MNLELGTKIEYDGYVVEVIGFKRGNALMRHDPEKYPDEQFYWAIELIDDYSNVRMDTIAHALSTGWAKIVKDPEPIWEV